MSNKSKIIEICNNLIFTIGRIRGERRLPMFQNDMFNYPIVQKKLLLKKLQLYKKKYGIRNDELRELA